MALSDEIRAFATYRNGLAHAREAFDCDELAHFEQDLKKAEDAMEVAWLEQKPTVGGALTAGPREPPLPRLGVEPIDIIGWTTSHHGGEW